RESRDLLGVATDQNRIRHHAVTVWQRDAALIADRQDRAHQVLVEPHASGDAIHDDAERPRRQRVLPRFFLSNRLVTSSTLKRQAGTETAQALTDDLCEAGRMLRPRRARGTRREPRRGKQEMTDLLSTVLVTYMICYS